MKQVLFIISLLNFSSFLWSVIGIFQKVSERSLFRYRLLQVNSLAIWISLSFAILNSDLSLAKYGLGISIQVICLFCFWSHTKLIKDYKLSIVFSEDQPTKILKKGLYRKIRHPFYTIYILTYFSLALLCGAPIPIILSLTILIIYVNAAMFEEQKFLNSTLEKSYSEYKKEAGMFFPKLN